MHNADKIDDAAQADIGEKADALKAALATEDLDDIRAKTGVRGDGVWLGDLR